MLSRMGYKLGTPGLGVQIFHVTSTPWVYSGRICCKKLEYSNFDVFKLKG
jgi:hypothetical protein